MTDTLELNLDADVAQLIDQVATYYHRALKDDAEVLDELHQRWSMQAEAIDRFRIGFCDRTLCLKLPAKQVKAGRQIRNRLESLGVLRASGHEHFRGSITFPVPAADGSGRIVDMYGYKRLWVQLRKGTLADVFLAPERRGVWNIEAFTATDEIIFCSSLWDALAFWNHGYRNATCTFSEILTNDHLRACADFNIRRALVASEAMAPPLLAAGVDCFRLRFPPGIDVTAYAREAANPAEALGAIIRNAEWIANGEGASAPATAGQSSVVPPVALEKNAAAPDTAPPAEMNSPATAEVHASPLPSAPHEIKADVKDDEVFFTFGDRRYRIRGWTKNLSGDQLKVNVRVVAEQAVFVDTFDLFSAKYRRSFVVQASQELGIEEQTIKKDLGNILLKLEELQDHRLSAEMKPKETVPEMTEAERAEALCLLRDPRLLERIIDDFDVVGERTNKLLGYLAAISRKLDQPLAVIVQSSSAAGKTALMEGVLSFVPPEDQVKFSAMTGQSLFYMGEGNLQHKILAIVEEEGAQRASYALKLLQSEGELRIASTGKDATSGRMVTQEYRVQGPVMIFLTTTAIKIDEELLNRCLVLTVDEEREQTRAIHQQQRKRQTLEGLLAVQAQQETLALHRNAQRLLRPILVANPFAESLTFLDDKTRTRRDHMKYLTLIRAIALLHQHQRPIQTVEHQGKAVEYIEVALEDVELANRLMTELLGRSAEDLPPQTRRLLLLIDQMVTTACREKAIDRADFRFSRRQVREYTGCSVTQVKVHLNRLMEMEYLLVHRGGRGQTFVYELFFDAAVYDGHKFVAKLLDVAQLRRNLTGANGHVTDSRRGQNAPKTGPCRTSEIDVTSCEAITDP